MNTLISLPLGAITLPTQFANIISFAIIAVISACTITAMVKIGMGFKQWVRGDDAFSEIKSGFLIAAVPWAVQAAFDGIGIYARLGIPLVPSAFNLPPEMITIIQYGLWIVVSMFLAIGIFVAIEGGMKTSRGEDGMRQIWGGIAMCLSPFLMILAFKLGGYWDAMGLQFL